MKNCLSPIRKLLPALMVILAVSVTGPLPALADEVCIRSFLSADPIDGVVAPGEATATCSADTLWPQVGPVHLHPTGSQVETYMYISRISGTQMLRIGIDTAGDPDVSNFDTIMFFFDANNDDAWDNTDFAVRIRVRPDEFTVTDSGEDCGQQSGAVQYYQRSGGGWGSNNPDAAGDITVLYAYDYSDPIPDSESNIWNIELEIPINGASPYQINTSGPDYFALGVYVFADQGQLPEIDPNGQVRVWPGDLKSVVLNGPPQIAQYNSTLAILEPDPAALGNINLEDVCFDVNFDMAQEPWLINNHEAATGDEHLNRNANNSFRVTYYFDGPLSEIGELPNSGTVRLGLNPKTAGSWGNWWNKEKTSEVTTYNNTHVVDFDFDFSTADDANFRSPETSVVCAHGTLENFKLNDNTSNDEMHLNLHYFTTSESMQTLWLYGRDLPKLKSGEINKVYLKMEMSNEHPKLSQELAGALKRTTGTDDGRGGAFKPLYSWFIGSESFSVTTWLRLFAGITIIVISLICMLKFKVQGIVTRITTGLGILLLIGPIVTACNSKIIREQPEIGTPRWQLMNTEDLGLKPVKDRKNLYELPLKRDDVKSLKLRFIGQPLPYKMEKQRLRAAINGKPNKIDLPVKPGTVVTVLAFGTVDVDGKSGPLQPTTAAGFTRKQKPGLKRTTSRAAQPLFFGVPQKIIGKHATVVENVRYRYPLTEGYYTPSEHSGALIGSFDGFKTSFVVGPHKSIVVPKEAKTLSLAVNAMLQDYANLTGYFDVGTIITEAPKVPTRTIPGGDATYNIPMIMPHWHTLTSLNIYTYYEDPLIKDGQVLEKTMRPWGNVHYVIYDTHATRFTNLNARLNP